MEDVGIFYVHLEYFVACGILCCHLVYFVAIWYILWPFSIFYFYLVHFSRFGMLYQEKSGNPSNELFGEQFRI
jgi:hypothetical protein